jgi:hypothetical protein
MTGTRPPVIEMVASATGMVSVCFGRAQFLQGIHKVLKAARRT